jgi:hypothetical protein
MSIWVGAVLQHWLYEARVATLECHMEWTATIFKANIRVCTVFKKNFCSFWISFVLRYNMQRGHASEILGIRVCAMLEQ